MTATQKRWLIGLAIAAAIVVVPFVIFGLGSTDSGSDVDQPTVTAQK
jgi:hypothetical protein